MVFDRVSSCVFGVDDKLYTLPCLNGNWTQYTTYSDGRYA